MVDRLVTAIAGLQLQLVYIENWLSFSNGKFISIQIFLVVVVKIHLHLS